MLRVFSVLAAAVVLATLSGCGADTKPYLWPTPVYGVPFINTSFEVRYNPLLNTPDEIREVIAKYCGPQYDIARVTPTPAGSTVLHSESLSVACGLSPEQLPRYRGEDRPYSYLLPLRDSPFRSTAPAQ